MKKKNNLIYRFIFTILLIVFIIWNRLLRERLPREISYHKILSTYDILITIISYYTLKYFKIIPRPKSKFKIIRDKLLHYLESKTIVIHFMSFFEEHITNGPSKVYDYFYVVVYIKPFIWYCGKLLDKFFHDKPFIPYIIGFIIPKSIIVIVLLVEIYFFNCLHYFYTVLILYIIPLITKILLYMIHHHCKRNLDLLHEYFKFKFIDEWNSLEIINKPFEDVIKLQQQENLLHYAKTNWLPLQYMFSVVAKIYQEKHKYEYLSSMIIYGLFTISFGIYLLKIIGFIG